MSCTKYTLTNTRSTLVTFNYRRCSDSLWVYQTPLQPNQTLIIFAITGTYSSPFAGITVVTDSDLPAYTIYEVSDCCDSTLPASILVFYQQLKLP
jgi:hypothetical protein